MRLHSKVQKNKQNGFIFVEVMIVTTLFGAFALLILNLSQSTSKTMNIERMILARDRVVSSLRSMAAMPATLRNSMRVAGYNQELVDCVNGTGGVGGCENQKQYPLELFAPFLPIDASGNVLGGWPVTASQGSGEKSYFDYFGVPCDKEEKGASCSIVAFTGFRPQCPPPPLPSPRPVVITPAMLEPMANCTVADIIEVYYSVEIDPASLGDARVPAHYLQPVVGYMAVPVIKITGNAPR